MYSINYSRTKLRRQCTSNVGIRLWNDLPIDISNISSIYLFKQKEYEVLHCLCNILIIYETRMACIKEIKLSRIKIAAYQGN